MQDWTVQPSGETSLVLFNERAKRGGSYNDNDWTLSCGGVSIIPTYSSGDGEYEWTFANTTTVPKDVTCSLSFTGDADSVVKNGDDTVDLAAISNETVNNFSTYETDTLNPVKQKIEILADGDHVRIEYNETVKIGVGGAPTPTFSTDGAAVTVSNCADSSPDDEFITCDLSRTISGTEVPANDFALTNAANQIEDSAGNDAGNISSGTVINNSTQTATPTNPYITDVRINSNGTTLEFDTNESVTVSGYTDGLTMTMQTAGALSFSCENQAGTTITCTITPKVYRYDVATDGLDWDGTGNPGDIYATDDSTDLADADNLGVDNNSDQTDEDYVEKIYITQTGADPGTHSVAWFNDGNNWNTVISDTDGKIGPGDVVYFSGTITDKAKVPNNVGGNSSAVVTIDGYKDGDCNWIGTGSCSGSAQFTDGFMIGANVSWITVQDINSTDQTGSISYDEAFSVTQSSTGESNEWITVKRNYFHDSGARLVKFVPKSEEQHPTISHILFEDNKCLNYGLHEPDCEAGITFVGVQDVVIRRNIIGHTGPIKETSDNTVDFHECQKFFFENNTVFGSQRQSGFTPKEGCIDNDWFFVTKNSFHDNWIIGGVMSFMVHGYMWANAVYNNGMDPSIPDNDVQTGWRNGKRCHDIYSWSNIYYNNGRYGNYSWNRGSSYCGHSMDLQGDIYNFNETYVNNGHSGATDKWEDSGLSLDSNPGGNYQVINNIFANNRASSVYNTKQQLVILNKDDIDNLSYNTFFSSAGTPTTYIFGDGHYTASELVAAGYSNNLESDPGFSNESQNNFTLDGTHVENGTTISDSILPDYDNKITIQVPGETISFCNNSNCDVLVSFSVALHPDTDWTTTIPTVVTADQNLYGSSWERGAYVYVP